MQSDVESRKRPHLDDGEPFQVKKRVLTGPNDTPHVNGIIVDEAEEPAYGDNLELFRKEAIFRRMKHYSREHERSKAYIQELERRKSTCEAGLAAISACWTQLEEAIRLLARPEDLPPVDAKTKDIFDLTMHASKSTPNFASALKDNMHATQALVTKFAQLGSQAQSAVWSSDSYSDCQKAQTECATLRSELSLTLTKLRDAESDRDKLHSELVAAEIRADRLQSATVLAMQARAAAEKQEPKNEEKPEIVEEPEETKPSSPLHTPSNGIQHSSELEEWQEVARTREEKIFELEKENALLRDETNLLTLEIKAPQPDTIADSQYYKVLLQHASKLQHTVDESRQDLTAVRDELCQIRSIYKTHEESVNRAAQTASQELQGLLTKRDNDLSRLRDQREQQAAELNERKHKDSVKMASVQEWKDLAESRSERIAALRSELTRHRAQLAANTGNEDLMTFFFRANEVDASYIEDLRSRVTAAENRASALEQSFTMFDDEHPEIMKHIKAETEAREQLAEAARRLEKYQSIYGEPSQLPPDVRILEEQLRLKEDEIQRLRLADVQRGQAETSLYSELDKLSAAWEALDRQVKRKIFDLSAMEDRLTKSALDKAKSENKFYAAMRDKEAIETERKNISRNLEKQGKAIERLVESEKSLTLQVMDLEKEIVLSGNSVRVQKERVRALERENSEWKARAEAEKQRVTDSYGFLQDREKALDRKKADLRKVEEGFVRSKKEVEKQAIKLKTAQSLTGSQKESELQSEVDKCMSILKCSTCKMHMRSTVITKCMHSFCKPCVESRISTRQRKCPACNLAFAQSDVQQLYFQ